VAEQIQEKIQNQADIEGQNVEKDRRRIERGKADCNDGSEYARQQPRSLDEVLSRVEQGKKPDVDHFQSASGSVTSIKHD
jgi:hypothetical protein